MTEQEKALFALGLTEEEVAQVLADDKRIDRGEKLFELTAEQKQASKEARQAPRTPTVYKFTKREKKAKPEKAQICSAMMEGLTAMGVSEFDITNAEREFIFVHNGTKYKVTLACPRS